MTPRDRPQRRRGITPENLKVKYFSSGANGILGEHDSLPILGAEKKNKKSNRTTRNLLSLSDFNPKRSTSKHRAIRSVCYTL